MQLYVTIRIGLVFIQSSTLCTSSGFGLRVERLRCGVES